MRSWIVAWVLLLGLAAQGQQPGRRSITFVVGSDPAGAPPALSPAARHFREHPQERTDFVVTEVTSLSGLRDHLAQHPAEDGGPWGLVNIVVHADRQGAIDLPLVPEGSRADEDSLRTPPFSPLSDAVLDGTSEIRIHGCGVGRFPGLLRALSRALGGDDAQRPLVRATPFYTSFQEEPDPQDGTRRHICRVWQVTQPEGRWEEGKALARRFSVGAEVDVASALQRRRARWSGDVFRCDGEARFTWSVFSDNGTRPDLPPRGPVLLMWLRDQKTFGERLRRAGFALPDLAWSAAPAEVTHEGRQYEALKVEGRGRVVHLLQALDAPGEIPPERAFEDPTYFVSVR